MERAAVFIGVNKTGQLPTLNAAVSGAKKMADWADKQLIGNERIKFITDEENQPVTVARIKAAISEVARLKVVEQLIVYFAGHGMYTNGSEFWLLTNAPGDSDEAVNVARSQDDARIGVFRHVIFISDACRGAAVGRQFQEIRGSSIFPNPDQPARPERSVDLFFACGFDNSSIETSNVSQPDIWRSIYTDTLHDVLSGDFPLVLDSEMVDGAPAALVKTQRLKPFLTDVVPDLIIRAGFAANAVQTPDARVCSPASAWVSILSPPPAAFSDMFPTPGGPGPFQKTASAKPQSATSKANGIVVAALTDINIDMFALLPKPSISFTDAIESPDTQFISNRPAFISTASRIRRADAKAPESFETGCGFVLSGAQLVGAQVIDPVAQVDSTSNDAAKIRTSTIANVLLTFSNGRGTVLPAIPGFIATLTFQADLLASVSWQQVGPVEDPNLQSLRAVVASLSQRGAFRLDANAGGGETNARLLANRIRDAKTADPSMAVYAAYAFYDLQLIDRIDDMAAFLADRLHLAFFDLALLTRALDLLQRSGQRLFPFFPLLSRGWSLLPRETLPPNLSNLYAHLTPSQWSLFDPEGVAMIQAAIQNQEVS